MACLCVCVSLSEAGSSLQLFSSGGQFQAQGVSVPFYVGVATEPAAVAYVASMHTDYERKGFFRIGLLPVGILEGVTLEIRNPQRTAEALEQMRLWAKSSGARRIELRQVKFRMTGAAGVSLEAGRAWFRPDNRLEFSEGVRLEQGTNRIHAAHATLEILGTNSGRLVLDSIRPLTNNLFAGFNRKEPFLTSHSQ